MGFASVTIQGVQKLRRDLNVQDNRTKRALNVAIKVEGFRLLRKLRDDIQAGRPGGTPYDKELSKIAGFTKKGNRRLKKIPLYRLARMLRYNVRYAGGEIDLRFGFVNANKSKLSMSWKQLLLRHEEGADALYTGSRTELGRRFARIGGRLKKRGDPDARYFFLRRETGRRGFSLPERSMIPAFWDANKERAKRNISENFKRKLRGERI